MKIRSVYKSKMTGRQPRTDIKGYLICNWFVAEYLEPKSIVLVDRIKRGTGYTYKWKDNATEEFENLIRLLNEYLIKENK